MLKKIAVIYDIIIIICPLVFFVWDYLPSFSFTLEIFLANQTLKLFCGLMCLFLALLRLNINMNSKIYVGLSAVVSSLLIVQVLNYSAGLPAYAQNDRMAVSTEGYFRTLQNTFTIYSHNVLYKGFCSDELLDTVGELSPDIVILQEFDERHYEFLNGKFEEMGYNGYCHYSQPTNGAFAFAVYSQFPVCNDSIFYTEGPLWKPQWPNHSFEFNYQGEWIKVVNVHIIPPHNPTKGDTPDPVQYSLVPVQMGAVFRAAGSGGNPAIICGDFNQTPSSSFIVDLRETFVDAWIEAGCGLGFSWFNPFPLFRIDYIFHSSHLRTIYCTTIKNEYSDHLGLFAVMSLNG